MVAIQEKIVARRRAQITLQVVVHLKNSTKYHRINQLGKMEPRRCKLVLRIVRKANLRRKRKRT